MLPWLELGDVTDALSEPLISEQRVGCDANLRANHSAAESPAMFECCARLRVVF